MAASSSIGIVHLESIEPRLLLSFASLSAHGTLSVVGTSQNDSIVVKFSGSHVQAIVNGQTKSFNKSDVKRIWSEAFEGNDRISNQTNLPSTLIGDGGNDTLTGGTGSDSLDGGDGNDTADYSSRTAPVTAEILIDEHDTDPNNGVGGSGGQSGEHDTYRSINTLVGGSGNDSFTVFDANDDAGSNIPGQTFLLDGRDGNDSFYTNSYYSDMTVMGGNGNDHFSFRNVDHPSTLLGGPGDDYFTNDNEDDDAVAHIDGGSGYDTEEYGAVPDVTVTMGANLEKFISIGVGVIGNDLNNLIIASPFSGAIGAIHGGGGNDTIQLTQGPNSSGPYTVFGDAGNDTISGANGVENILHGGDGNDLITGGDSGDSINGDAGNDSINGGGGNDTLHGGSGNDTLDGGLGADDLFGDGGTDTADYSHRTQNLRLSLDNIANDGASGEGDNIHADVENILGGSGNDFIQGNPFANKLVGNAGNDTIFGGDGNDTLIGGAGADHLDGQGGTDVIIP